MGGMSRRDWLKATSAGLAAGLPLGVFPGRARAARKPNIIFILADDLGYGDLGCYGQQQIATPYLDRMAAEGLRFTDCYAGSTVCAPSRSCLMTGQHTGHTWVRGNKRVPLRPEDRTVAELLKEAGYKTGLIGKWGLGEPGTSGIPNRQGFDYFFGYLNQRNAHNYYPEYLWRNEEKVYLNNVLEQPLVASQANEYSHDLFTEEALAFVKKHRDEPFFLYLSYTIPHANNERGAAKGNGMEVPSLGQYAGEDWPVPQKGHAAMISRMDADVGKLLDHLGRLGIDEETVVFFTSDNGPHKEGGADPAFFNSAGPLRGYKRDLYEGGIRVPAMVRWPETIAKGGVSDQPWAFWDFLPTAVELAGAEPLSPEAGVDGISIAPTLLGEPERQAPHPPFYWEFHERTFKQAVRMDTWKAVRPSQDAPVEIYALCEDLGEERNLASEQPDLVSRAKKLFEEMRIPSPHWPVRGEG